MAGNSSLLRIFCLYYPADKSAFSCLSVLGMGIAGSSPCANPPSRCAATSSPPRTTRTVLGLSSLCLVVILPNKFNWRYSPQEGDFFSPLIFHCFPPPKLSRGAVGSGARRALGSSSAEGIGLQAQKSLHTASLFPSAIWHLAPECCLCPAPRRGHWWHWWHWCQGDTGGLSGGTARVTLPG